MPSSQRLADTPFRGGPLPGPFSEAAASDLSTGLAPPFRAPAGPATGAAGKPALLEPGQRVGDFEIRAVLGEGAFSRVYLARQISLGRLVALKASASPIREARTLAGLEHDHIVQLFCEIEDRPNGLRFLCMQYVPGANLEQTLRALPHRRGAWDGRALLAALDRLAGPADRLALGVSRERERLARADQVEAVCLLGAKLAEALDYAHGQGVVHRDIKPANILLHRSGRPLLADFNLSFSLHRVAEMIPGLFGGTLPYMAPEHLDAFDPEGTTPLEAVDQRSDIYSLGVVLFEMVTGRRPVDDRCPDACPWQTLRAMVARRQVVPPPIPLDRPEIPEGLDRVIRRCLEPLPDRRYQTAAALVRDLEACGRPRGTAAGAPRTVREGRRARRCVLTWAVSAALLLQLVGGVLPLAFLALGPVAGAEAGVSSWSLLGGALAAAGGLAGGILLWAGGLWDRTGRAADGKARARRRGWCAG